MDETNEMDRGGEEGKLGQQQRYWLRIGKTGGSLYQDDDLNRSLIL